MRHNRGTPNKRELLVKMDVRFRGWNVNQVSRNKEEGEDVGRGSQETGNTTDWKEAWRRICKGEWQTPWGDVMFSSQFLIELFLASQKYTEWSTEHPIWNITPYQYIVTFSLPPPRGSDRYPNLLFIISSSSSHFHYLCMYLRGIFYLLKCQLWCLKTEKYVHWNTCLRFKKCVIAEGVSGKGE